MILNTNQLRAFFTAAKFASVTLAAQELMVTPPAVSMQIKQLEQTLGAKLIYREGHSIRLSEIGMVMYKKCKTIFGRINQLEDWVDSVSHVGSGILRVGCPPTPAKYFMPPLIKIFHEKYPGVKLILDQGSSSEMVKSIQSHSDEIAIVLLRPGEHKRKVKLKVFGSENLVLIAAPDSRNIRTERISVKQLSTVPLILPPKGSAIREVILDYLSRLKVKPMIIFELAGVELVKELVGQDEGICFLPFYAVQSDIEQGTLKKVHITEGWPRIDYGVAYLKRSSLSLAANTFIQILNRMGNIPITP